MTFADLVYRAWAVIYNNKQSWLGSIVAALAFVQASPQLRNLVEDTTYEWLMFGIGLLMVLFARSASGGTVASKVLPSSIPADRPSKDNGFVRPLMLVMLLAVGAIGAITIHGCTSVQTPQTLEEKALSTEHGINGAVSTLTTLVHSGAVSADDALRVREVAVRAHEAIGLIEQMAQSGDVAGAEQQLELIRAGLIALRSYLAAPSEDRLEAAETLITAGESP